jgi:ActR/RegA family two-component response regulator
MPRESGLDIVRLLRGLDATLFILMLTGYGSIAPRLKRSNAAPIITLRSQWT